MLLGAISFICPSMNTTLGLNGQVDRKACGTNNLTVFTHPESIVMLSLTEYVLVYE